MKEISIDTPKGKIRAAKGLDPNYPSIDVFIDNELAAVIEFHSGKDNIVIHTFMKYKEEPVSSHIFDDPESYDYDE